MTLQRGKRTTLAAVGAGVLITMAGVAVVVGDGQIKTTAATTGPAEATTSTTSTSTRTSKPPTASAAPTVTAPPYLNGGWPLA